MELIGISDGILGLKEQLEVSVLGDLHCSRLEEVVSVSF